MAMNGSSVAAEDPPAIADHALLLKAQVYIKDNLSLPTLGPELVARAAGVSRARLYRIFEPCGGIASYVREMRLCRAFTDLASPASYHRQIADIAYAWGFADAAHFSRCFRARFGVSPSCLRSSHVPVSPAEVRVSSEFGDTKYAFWIGAIA